MSMMIASQGGFGVVAEVNGEIAGSNFRNTAAGYGFTPAMSGTGRGWGYRTPRSASGCA